MPSPHAIVQQIIQRSGLRREEGRPLYAYRLTALELDALGEALRETFARAKPADGTAAAAFVMFAAECFCRTYNGGPWSWRMILEATGFQGNAPMLYGMVIRGLAFWNRKVILSGTERQFLVTLACEGGLPLKLLRNDNSGRLQRFFRELLAARESYRRPASDLVGSVAEVLPPTLRQDVVLGLAAQLIDAVAELRAKAGSSVDLVADLDRYHPEWREVVPLRLDDDVARQLLNGLLRAPRAPMVAFIEVQTRLCLEGAPRFERVARFPAVMPPAELARQLGVKLEELPPRVYLHLVTSDAARVPIATATLAADQGEFDITPIKARPIRGAQVVRGAVLLAASSGSRDLACVLPPGGEALDALPWALQAHAQQGGHVLLAVGAYRTAADELLLALPEEGVLTVEASATLEEVAVVGEPARRVVRLRGQARWEGEAERCGFRTSAATESGRFTLEGALRRFGFEGSEVWLGAPRWGRVERNDVIRELGPSFRQEWRPARAGQPWRLLGPECCGDVQLRLLRDGETVARTSATVFPRGVQMHVRPSQDARRGRLELYGLGDAIIGIECPESVRWESRREGTRTLVTLESEGKPPPSLGLRLQLDQGREARLQVPFPSKTRSFVSGGGELLSEHVTLTLDRLSSARARAIVEPGAHSFVVEAKIGDTWTVAARLRRVSDTCFELALEALRESISVLLASSTDLDASVRLRIVPEKGALVPPHPVIEVRRYDAAISPHRNHDGSIDLALDEVARVAIGPTGVQSLRLEARPLEDPSAAPIEVPRFEEHRFRIEQGSMAQGPWLILGFQGPLPRLRPLLVTISGSDDNLTNAIAATSAFDAAVRTRAPQARMTALAEVVKGMASDLDHPDWLRVQRYAGTLGTLPATTFDVIRAMIATPDAVVATLLVCGASFEALWAGLEELPFCWALVPVRSWIRGMKAMLKSVDAKMELWRAMGWDLRRARSETLAPLWTRALKQAPFMATILEVVTMTIRGVPDAPQQLVAQARTPAGRSGLDRHLDVQRADLLIRHAHSDERWPECDVYSLAEQAGIPQGVLDEIRIPADLDHRRDVYNAPGVAAAVSVIGSPCPLPLLLQIRRLRAFDEDWFDMAHAVSLTKLLGKRFAADKGAFDDA